MGQLANAEFRRQEAGAEGRKRKQDFMPSHLSCRSISPAVCPLPFFLSCRLPPVPASRSGGPNSRLYVSRTFKPGFVHSGAHGRRSGRKYPAGVSNNAPCADANPLSVRLSHVVLPASKSV